MVKVRESNHMHGWRRISHESRFDHFTYSQDNSEATETSSGLKEILLLLLLGVSGSSQTLAPFLTPVIYDFAASHTTLIQVASMSASSDTLKVGVLFKSFHVDQCPAAGWAMPHWQTRWWSGCLYFGWAIWRALRLNLLPPTWVFPGVLYSPLGCNMPIKNIPKIFKWMKWSFCWYSKSEFE